MDIQEYKNKIEWYFKEEYSELPIEEITQGSDELSNDIDTVIECGYLKKIHFPIVARRLRNILKRYYNDVGEGL